MFKFNSQCIPDSRQCPIDGVKEVIATCIVLRSDPFGLHYPPQGFRKVQVRGIRRKVKEEIHKVSARFRCGEYGGR